MMRDGRQCQLKTSCKRGFRGVPTSFSGTALTAIQYMATRPRNREIPTSYPASAHVLLSTMGCKGRVHGLQGTLRDFGTEMRIAGDTYRRRWVDADVGRKLRLGLRKITALVPTLVEPMCNRRPGGWRTESSLTLPWDGDRESAIRLARWIGKRYPKYVGTHVAILTRTWTLQAQTAHIITGASDQCRICGNDRETWDHLRDNCEGTRDAIDQWMAMVGSATGAPRALWWGMPPTESCQAWKEWVPPMLVARDKWFNALTKRPERPTATTAE